jgi:hypothetical protein
MNQTCFQLSSSVPCSIFQGRGRTAPLPDFSPNRRRVACDAETADRALTHFAVRGDQARPRMRTHETRTTQGCGHNLLVLADLQVMSSGAASWHSSGQSRAESDSGVQLNGSGGFNVTASLCQEPRVAVSETAKMKQGLRWRDEVAIGKNGVETDIHWKGDGVASASLVRMEREELGLG